LYCSEQPEFVPDSQEAERTREYFGVEVLETRPSNPEIPNHERADEA
jgi:hypothetical protein